MGIIMRKGIVYGGSGGGTAESITYDNSVSGLEATTTQDALDELSGEKVNYGDVVDNLLSTATDLPLSANQGTRIYNMLGEQLAYYKSSSTTSFRACHNDVAGSLSGFLDANIHNVISTFAEKAMHQVIGKVSGVTVSPYFFATLSKFSNSYYCGTIHNYDTNQGCMYSYFSYCNGTFVIYSPRVITYGK